jgi:CBS domain-containing protein
VDRASLANVVPEASTPAQQLARVTMTGGKPVIGDDGATESDTSRKLLAFLKQAELESKSSQLQHIRNPKRNPAVALSWSANLVDLIQLVKKKNPVRRFLMTDAKTNKVNHIITLSDLVHFCCTHVGELCFGHVMDRPIEELGLVDHKAKPVLCVTNQQAGYDAFKMMVEHNITGCGVTDAASGKLIGCVSQSDLVEVGFSLHGIQRLFAPLSAYLGMRKARETKKAAPLFSVKASATLQHVLEQMDSHHIHRVFVTTDDDFPVGVVSQSDAIRALLS